jgi:hypothetical protein
LSPVAIPNATRMKEVVSAPAGDNQEAGQCALTTPIQVCGVDVQFAARPLGTPWAEGRAAERVGWGV